MAHGVWIYFRFPLSLCLVEDMLPERGIVVSREPIRRWAMKFGPDHAWRLKRKVPGRYVTWHLDDDVISIAGEKRSLWRAVDQDGYVLDEIVQVHRNTKAAMLLLRRLLGRQGRGLRPMITDKLGPCAAARRKLMPDFDHRSHKGLNSRAGNSHVPLRKRDNIMQGFRSWRGVQRFAEVFSTFRNPFVPHRPSRQSAIVCQSASNWDPE
ncbi:MAG: IS6 family transposase [Hyphomicrobiales bacterium]|nr:IS6 family transposase [Hyphomicrobiales bacterium]